MTRLIAVATRKPAESPPKCFACNLPLHGSRWICPKAGCEKMEGLCFECYALHVKTAHDKELH